MRTQHRHSALRSSGRVFAASLFTATVIWPWLLGTWGNAIRPLIVVVILVDFVA